VFEALPEKLIDNAVGMADDHPVQKNLIVHVQINEGHAERQYHSVQASLTYNCKHSLTD